MSVKVSRIIIIMYIIELMFQNLDGWIGLRMEKRQEIKAMDIKLRQFKY